MVWESKKHVVPRLDYFENQGVMTGSKEFPRVDHCYNYCRDNGQIKAEAEFPLTNEGTDEIFHWLEEMYTVMERESRNKN